jgi:hypothetical protein
MSWLTTLAAGAVWPAAATAQFTAVRLSEGTSYVWAVRDGVVGGHVIHSVVDPVLWLTPGLPPTSLGSAAGGGGAVYAMTATQQFGAGGAGAAMWSGTPESFVSLHPPGAAGGSSILDANSTQQVGWTLTSLGSYETATLWSGTAASVISLAPPGSIGSVANAMTETHQGGWVIYAGQPGQGSAYHAALWNGSAASFVDLNPDGHVSSITGMFGDQQVGSAQVNVPGSDSRAAMWFGTPESFRTMHPFATGLSAIGATCGSAQVGYMSSPEFGGGGIRAAIWFGTAESVFDLSQFLPAGYGQSIATCVEERDGIFTVGGYVRYGPVDQAFVWTGVPAPSSAIVLVGAALLAARRRRH